MKRLNNICLIFLLVLQAILIGVISWKTSPNKTEVAHLGAAAYFWKTAKFDVFHVNPPLTRIPAGLPLALLCEIDLKTYSPRPQDRCEWPIGLALIESLDLDDLRLYVFLSRMTCLPFVLLGGFLCYRLSSELFGPGAGLVALTLWTFSPLLLGWGATICPDVAAASIGLLGLYTFWHWLKSPIWKNAVISGLCLGLMPLAKMTWIVAVPIWTMLYVTWMILRKDGEQKIPLRQFAAILLVAWYAVNMGYLFDGSFRKLGDYQFISSSLTGRPTEKDAPVRPGNRFAETWMKNIPVPLPKEFVLGIDTQKLDFERGIDSYARGAWSDHGWIWYYAYVLLLKEPLATWGLVILAFVAACCGRRLPLRDELILLIPLGTVFLFISSQTGFSLHPRYVVLILPLSYIAVSRLALSFSRKSPVLATLTAFCLLGTAVSSMAAFPYSMSYFNELAGSREQRPRHLLGSNIDWGQNIFFLRDRRKRHPDTNPFYVTYTQSIPLERLDLNDEGLVPTEPTVGWMLLGVNERFDRTGKYDWLDRYEPVEIVAEAIWLYRIDEIPVRNAAQNTDFD